MKKIVCLFMVLVCASAYAGTITASWTGQGNTTRPDSGGGFFWNADETYTSAGNWGSLTAEWGDASHQPNGRTLSQAFKLNAAQNFGAFAFQLYRTAGQGSAPGVDLTVKMEVWEIPVDQVKISAVGNTKLASFTGQYMDEIKTSTGNEWVTFAMDQVLQLDADKWYAVTIGWNEQFETANRKIRPDNDAYNLNLNLMTSRTNGDPSVPDNWTGNANRSMDFVLVTPEPTTVVLLSLGGLLLRRRK